MLERSLGDLSIMASVAIGVTEEIYSNPLKEDGRKQSKTGGEYRSWQRDSNKSQSKGRK